MSGTVQFDFPSPTYVSSSSYYVIKFEVPDASGFTGPFSKLTFSSGANSADPVIVRRGSDNGGTTWSSPDSLDVSIRITKN